MSQSKTSIWRSTMASSRGTGQETDDLPNDGEDPAAKTLETLPAAGAS
jgi:hypothetical protein